jgi:hypothetical protein
MKPQIKIGKVSEGKYGGTRDICAARLFPSWINPLVKPLAFFGLLGEIFSMVWEKKGIFLAVCEIFQLFWFCRTIKCLQKQQKTLLKIANLNFN